MAGNQGITFTDVINEALGHLNVYQGDPLDASDLQTAFFTLCAIIDGYGAETLMIWEHVAQQFVTQAGKQSYLVGPAGATIANDWIVPALPSSFEHITWMLGTEERELKLLTESEWVAIPFKSLAGGLLESCYPNLGTLAHTLNFYWIPNAALPVNLYLPRRVVKPTAANNAVIFPSSYQECLTFELVIKASSKFGAPIPAWIPPAWEEAKGKIKAANFQAIFATCDAALLNHGSRFGGSDAFYTGQ